MKRISILLVSVIIALCLGACSESNYIDSNTNSDSNNASNSASGNKKIQNNKIIKAQDKLENKLLKKISKSKVETLDSSKRAIKLLNYALKDKSKNAMVSPLSAELILQLSMNGMTDDCRNDFEKYFGKTLADINEYNKNYIDKSNKDNSLSIANSVWVRDYLIKSLDENVSNTVKDVYKSEIQSFDNSSLNKINNWVSDKTNKLIPSIIDEISDDMISILINAIYFKGEWEKEFSVDDTKSENFILADNSTVKSDLMHDETDIYYENKDATGFSKYYKEGYKFTAILPNDINKFDINKFDINKFFSSYEPSKYDYEVDIKIPKFEYGTEIKLKDLILELGLDKLLKDDSLSPMFKDDISAGVSEIIQRTFIKMDEKGTEAAAVTGMMIKNTSIKQKDIKQVKVYLNKPFYYLITDKDNNIIFIGYVANPTLK